MMAVLAVGSLLIGNLAAIAAKPTSSACWLSLPFHKWASCLLAFVAGNAGGNYGNTTNAYSAGMFYAVTYVLTTLATFGVIMMLSRRDFESEELAIWLV